MTKGSEMATQELAPRETTPMQVPDTMMILQAAVQKGADITTIERLVALQEKMLAREAEIEFNDALFRVQSSLATVRTDMENTSTRSKYASYAQLDRAVRPFYSRERMSLSFDTEESPKGADYVRVLCYVSRGAHTRTYRYDIPADGKGPKGNDVMSKTHATGAAGSYGMRYLLKMIFNLSIGEDDTDGNSMGELVDILNKV